MMKKNLLILIALLSILSVFLVFKVNKKAMLDEENLAVYVNNQLVSTIPKKGEAMYIKSVCDTDVNVSWNNDSWGLLINNLKQKTKCNLYFYQGQTVYNFDYTGGEQTFTTPVSGTYKLETWGGQGGGWGDGSAWIREGYGGYSRGDIYLEKGSKLYLNVAVGGAEVGNKGGGATSIALISGKLTELKGNISSILMVAGGGGASEWGNGKGGSAGGYIGVSGQNPVSTVTGGTQTSGGKSAAIHSSSGTTKIYDGSFGNGGYSLDGDNGGNGGDGFYGGGASSYTYGGGGGSSYIGNSLLTEKAMYCYNCEESNEESTKTISTTCTSETPMKNCSKEDNGYARITLISIDE